MWKYYDYRIDIYRCFILFFRLKLIFGYDGLWILEMGEINLINIYINFFYYFLLLGGCGGFIGRKIIVGGWGWFWCLVLDV